jgi:hypothetical protein
MLRYLIQFRRYRDFPENYPLEIRDYQISGTGLKMDRHVMKVYNDVDTKTSKLLTSHDGVLPAIG